MYILIYTLAASLFTGLAVYFGMNGDDLVAAIFSSGAVSLAIVSIILGTGAILKEKLQEHEEVLE